MKRSTGGFTLVEVVVTVVVMGLLLAVLVPMAGRVRNGDAAQVSRLKLSQIIRATAQYCADNAGRVPLRACGYSNGMLTGGWDTWNVGGKNCSTFWSTQQIFDESAYARFLNPYLFDGHIPRPPGYVNTGSGATWTFAHGSPTAQQRTLQIFAFQSPGDVATRQRNWPSPTAGVSAYDDVGTSYLANMKWWDSITTGSFAQRFEAGLVRINQAFAGANPDFVFMHDQTADIVANSFGNFQILGEFGKVNASMMGFADGRVDYLQVTVGGLSGPGYTFVP